MNDTITVEIDMKRPLHATKEKALEMYRSGIKQAEIARQWGISRQRVNVLIKKAIKAEKEKL